MSEYDIPIRLIDPNPYQPRIDFDKEKIAELAVNINKVGLINRILVRPHPEVDGRYQRAKKRRVI